MIRETAQEYRLEMFILQLAPISVHFSVLSIEHVHLQESDNFLRKFVVLFAFFWRTLSIEILLI